MNSSKASFAELWRDSRSPSVLLLWLTKLMGVRVPGSVNDANVSAMDPYVVDSASLPPFARQRIEARIAELAAVGFAQQPVACYWIDDVFNNSRTAMALLYRPDGQAFARVVFRTEGTRNPPKTHSFVEMITARVNGSFNLSTSARAYLDPPAGVRVAGKVGAAPAKLWAMHEASLRTQPSASPIAPANDPVKARALMERYHATVRDFLLERGLFQPMDERDLDQNAILLETYADSRQQGFEYPEVMVEIERIQSRRSSWSSGIVVLGISLLLFVLAGRQSFNRDWEFIALLIPILFIHELGHYLAMLAFGYRNVSMFFVPFLGAAVKGRHYNIGGWKKALVALMGPVPGVLLGAVLGIVGVVLHQDLLLKCALLLLLLNGSNLLPILPMDGGRVLQALLFSRHWLLDVIFRVLAALALVLIGTKIQDRVFMPLGIALLIGIPAAYRSGRIAVEMRKAGVGAGDSNGNTIPPEAARAIITRLKASRSGAKRRSMAGNKLLAQQTLNIYETINARPPGWIGTLTLGAVHLFTIALALVFGLFVAIQQNPQLSRIFQSGLTAPRRAVEPGEVQVARGAPAPAATEPATRRSSLALRDRGSLVIANFSRSTSAHDAFAKAQLHLGAGESAEWFGQTVLIGFRPGDTAARRHWLALLEPTTDDVFVQPLNCRFMCKASSADSAGSLVHELNDYLKLPGSLHLIAPWSEDHRTPQQRAHDARARETLVQLMTVDADQNTDPELLALQRKSSEAYRRGDDDQAKLLGAQRQAIVRQNRQRAQQRIAAEPTSDQQVAKLYLAKFAEPIDTGDSVDEDIGDEADDSASQPTSRRASAWAARVQARQKEMETELGPLLGQAPAPHGSSSDHSPISESAGMATADASFVHLTLWWPDDPFTQPPAIATWLWSRGCTKLRYDFGTGIRSKQVF